jgi:hypothetical protein
VGRYPTVEQLLDEAVATTGLDDFGPGDFRLGLEVLLDSLDADADLDPSTDEAVVGLLRRRLTNRLRLEQWCVEHPGVDATAVTGPIDVIGLPRTGTTALGNMLSLDARLRPLRMWEQTEPVPPPVLAEEHADHRRIEQLAADARVPAEIHAMHLYEIDAAAEDSEVLGMAFHGQQMTLPVWGYHAWWRSADQTETFRYHRRVVGVLGSQRPPSRWLFKSPHHKFHPEAIVAAYPDVRFVMCHRDPARVVPSYSSLVSSIFPTPRTERDLHRVGAEISEHLRVGLEMLIAARARLGEDRFLDIHHAETIADPVGVVRRIGEFAGLEPSDELAAAVERWRITNRSGARGTHAYTPEQFGLTAAGLRDDYGFYISHFDVDIED